jgi:predicted RNase H-like HicB family nuclease
MNNTAYELIIYWDKADGIFVVEVPELAGCMAHGATRTDAVKNAEDAIADWIQTAQEDGTPVPEPRGKLMFA